MPITIPRSWSKRTVDPYNHTDKTTTGSVNDVLSDVVTGRTKTKRGQWRPPTNYSRTYENRANSVDVVGYASKRDQYGDWRTFFSGAVNCSGYWFSALPSFPGTLQSRCEIGARIKLKNESINLATNFGERAQTAGLVFQTCKRLHDGVVAARRLDPRALANALGISRRKLRKGSAFDMWLEAQYGWKPLLQDVHAAVTKLSDDETGSKPPIVTVKSGGRERDEFFTYPGDSCLQTLVGSVRFKKLHRVEHKCMVRLDFIPENHALIAASQLGLTNPLEVGWELVPFSFVVDWFYPVGNYFQQLDATLGYSFKGGSISKKTSMKTQVLSSDLLRTDGLPASLNGVTGYCYSSSKGYQMSFSRSVYSSAPLPAPKLSFKDKSSAAHVENGIALLASAFTKKV